MAKPTPLTSATRDAVEADIRLGIGRNAIARKHNVSPGAVTNIARARGLWFDRCTQTASASMAHQADCAAARMVKEAQLLDQYLVLPTTFRLRDGRPTKASRRIDYALYNLNRHHR